jgi:hypothetical protein
MPRPKLFVLFVTALCLALTTAAEAQRMNRNAGQAADPNAGQGKKGKKAATLPEDARLLEIHKAFVMGAEKLAQEYMNNKDMDKARDCYREILRLVPGYPDAQEKLDQIVGKEQTAARKVVDVFANKGWQDTGLTVIEGKPMVFRADGKWKLRMELDVTANGMAIPDDLRRFNLGSLIGLIDDGTVNHSASASVAAKAPAASSEAATASGATASAEGTGSTEAPPADASATTEPAKDEEEDKSSKPFFIGRQLDMTCKRSGKLYLRMYDFEPSDNAGKLGVLISGTFKGGKK